MRLQLSLKRPEDDAGGDGDTCVGQRKEHETAQQEILGMQ